MANLFRDSIHASVYAKFRPHPPQELIKTITDYLSEKIPTIEWKNAVDVGCGSGQASQPLAKHFTHVYGFDTSCAQIDEAIRLNPFNNISFKVSSAEDIPIDSNSVQLVTACQSVHWFDLNKFFVEAQRLLSPNGVLALFGYRMPDISHKDFKNDNRVKDLCKKFYKWPQLMWSLKERQLVDEGLASVCLPFGDQIRKEGFEAQVDVTALEVRGYLQSWSAYNILKNTDEEKAELFLSAFDAEIKSLFGDKRLNEIELKLHFYYYLLMTAKPND